MIEGRKIKIWIPALTALLLAVLLSACGQSLKATDTEEPSAGQYRIYYSDTDNTGLVSRIYRPKSETFDGILRELLEQFVSDETPALKLFYLWGHAYEFDGHNNWETMEAALKLVSGHDDIWYATNGEIYRYIKAFDQLIFSADGHLVENPTAADLWLRVSKEAVHLPAGSITRIGR